MSGIQKTAVVCWVIVFWWVFALAIGWLMVVVFPGAGACD